MRIDKFLKVSRLIKRRPVAKQVCDQGRVHMNGNVAKAGHTVSVGDELSIRFGEKVVTVRVESVQENVRKNEAASMYTVLSERQIE